MSRDMNFLSHIKLHVRTKTVIRNYDAIRGFIVLPPLNSDSELFSAAFVWYIKACSFTLNKKNVSCVIALKTAS